ncbi:MAG: radical SAM protein [Eubacteriales bacterium]
MKKIYYYAGERDLSILIEKNNKFLGLELEEIADIQKIEKSNYLYVSDFVFNSCIQKQDYLMQQFPRKCLMRKIEDLYTIPFNRVALEISGECNAKCKYCSTGSHNRLFGTDENSVSLSVKDVESLIDDLIERKIIDEKAIIDLYNWKEPLLNKDLELISKYLSNKGLEFTLSTNASVVPDKNVKGAFKGLTALIISMPGFSQKSYSKIYGFNFEIIKENIKTILKNFINLGFSGEATILYHVYQYNLHELPDAIKFAHDLGVQLYPCFAFPISFDVCIDYITHELSQNLLYEMSSDLFLFQIKDILEERSVDYYCNQGKLLTIDENRDLVLGCCIDRYSKYADKCYRLGDITQLDICAIRKLKEASFESEVCQICRKTGADYCGSNCGTKFKQLFCNYFKN